MQPVGAHPSRPVMFVVADTEEPEPMTTDKPTNNAMAVIWKNPFALPKPRNPTKVNTRANDKRSKNNPASKTTILNHFPFKCGHYKVLPMTRN